MSPKQSMVLRYLVEHGTISVKQAVKLIGRDVYANQAFHCGNVLRNMVKQGMLSRVKPGVYQAMPQYSWTKKMLESEVMPSMQEWAKKHGLV